MAQKTPGLLTKFLNDSMEHVCWNSVCRSRCPGGRVVQTFVYVDTKRTLENIEERPLTAPVLFTHIHESVQRLIETKASHFKSHEHVCACVELYAFMQAYLAIAKDYESAIDKLEALGRAEACEAVDILLRGEIIT